MAGQNPKIVLFANTDWYLYNFRLSLAVKLRSEGWEVLLVSPPGEYSPKLVDLGFRWIPFALCTCSTNPLREFLVFLRLVWLYRREQPDLVHHFTIKCVLYGSLAARVTGIKKVVNAVTGLGHIFTDSGYRARILRPVIKLLYRLVLGNIQGRVIFQNEEDRWTFIELGMVDLSLTRLIRGSGVNCDYFVPCPSYSLPQGIGVRILFASRLLREKGICELIEAARVIRRKGLYAEFMIAGDLYLGNPSSLTGDDLDAIRKEGLVTYLGHVDDMHALIAGSDIVVLPSYREGTPRILIEAAAMGKPIVATDIAGCNGLVVDGSNGLLVSPKTIEPLVKALETLIGSAELRKEMGGNGRKIVLEEFDERIVLQKTFAVYRELVVDDINHLRNCAT